MANHAGELAERLPMYERSVHVKVNQQGSSQEVHRGHRSTSREDGGSVPGFLECSVLADAGAS